MDKYGNVDDHAAFPVELIVRGSDVIACNFVLVCDFALVGDGSVKGAGLTMANASNHCIFMICLLLRGKRSHFAVLLEMLDYFCPPI